MIGALWLMFPIMIGSTERQSQILGSFRTSPEVFTPETGPFGPSRSTRFFAAYPDLSRDGKLEAIVYTYGERIGVKAGVVAQHSF